jgi:hypothetical protein
LPSINAATQQRWCGYGFCRSSNGIAGPAGLLLGLVGFQQRY